MKRVLIIVCVVLFSISVFAVEKETKVRIITNMGKIDVKLFNETPQHRDNFIKLVQENQYDSILFHRIVKLVMIQAGEKYPPLESTNLENADEDAQNDLDAESAGKLRKFFRKIGFKSSKKQNPTKTIWRDPDYKTPDYKIPAEIVYPQYFHKRGRLCAAREGNNVNPERASSAMQFYIVTGKHYTDNELNKMEIERNIKFTPEQREAYKIEGGTPRLDGEYTVFGEVVKGMKTVQKIEFIGTDNYEFPVKEVRIKKMIILKK